VNEISLSVIEIGTESPRYLVYWPQMQNRANAWGCEKVKMSLNQRGAS